MGSGPAQVSHTVILLPVWQLQCLEVLNDAGHVLHCCHDRPAVSLQDHVSVLKR